MIRVMVSGCFDCLHIGHVRYLNAAAKLGDLLTVALTLDNRIDKGPGRPVFPWKERREMLLSLRCVYKVVVSHSGTWAVRYYHPDVYVKGKDWEGRLPEQQWCEENNIKVVFLDLPSYSSTKILTGELLRERIRASGSGLKQESPVLR